MKHDSERLCGLRMFLVSLNYDTSLAPMSLVARSISLSSSFSTHVSEETNFSCLHGPSRCLDSDMSRTTCFA